MKTSNLLDDARRGMPLDVGKDDDPSSGRFDFGSSDDVTGFPVPSLDEDVRQKRRDGLLRRRLIGSFILGTKPFESLVKTVCRAVLFVCGIRISVYGRENAAPGRQYVVMMNHVNFFDALVLAVAFPGPIRGIEEESHFRWPIYGSTIRRLGIIPICRTDTARALESLRQAADWIIP